VLPAGRGLGLDRATHTLKPNHSDCHVCSRQRNSDYSAHVRPALSRHGHCARMHRSRLLRSSGRGSGCSVRARCCSWRLFGNVACFRVTFFGFAAVTHPGHHAGSNFFGGFCFLNNAAIVARQLRSRLNKKIAVLDVDYHAGNGTER